MFPPSTRQSASVAGVQPSDSASSSDTADSSTEWSTDTGVRSAVASTSAGPGTGFPPLRSAAGRSGCAVAASPHQLAREGEGFDHRSGIGLACARLLAQGGWEGAILGRRSDTLEEAAAALGGPAEVNAGRDAVVPAPVTTGGGDDVPAALGGGEPSVAEDSFEDISAALNEPDDVPAALRIAEQSAQGRLDGITRGLPASERSCLQLEPAKFQCAAAPLSGQLQGAQLSRLPVQVPARTFHQQLFQQKLQGQADPGQHHGSSGFTAASRDIVELLRQRSRPYLFSNALAPGLVGGAIALLFINARLTSRKDAIEARLSTPIENRDYLLTSGFSAADISVGQAVYMARHFARTDAHPALSDWYGRLAARPAFQASLPQGDGIYSQDFYAPWPLE